MNELGELDDFGLTPRTGAAWWRNTASEGEQQAGETTILWLTGIFTNENLRLEVIDLIAARGPGLEVAELVQEAAPDVMIHSMVLTEQFKTDPGVEVLTQMFVDMTPPGWPINYDVEPEPFRDNPRDSA